LNCDICGREITGQAFKVRVEGAKMLVCHRCQKLGTPYVEERPSQNPTSRALTAPRMAAIPRVMHRKAPELPREMQELEIAEDYASRVRKRRMKVGLSQEQLAKRVKEKLSVIQKIETGKMAPDTRLCRELEHELKIELLVPYKESTKMPKAAAPTEVTLGDIVRVKDKSKSTLPP
jgi:putative transcription factor